MIVFHQQVISEKQFPNSKIVIGDGASSDFVITLPECFQTGQFAVFENGVLSLPCGCLASLSVRQGVYPVGEKRLCDDVRDGIEHYPFSEDDWVIIRLAPGLDFVICYRDGDVSGLLKGAPILALSQILESPLSKTLLFSFLVHSAFIFFAGLTSNPVEKYVYQLQQNRWVELVGEVDEVAEKEEEKEPLPTVEDTDDVIVDTRMQTGDHPKIDDNPSPIANLQKVEKPVGLQAALGGVKLHDMESLFGSGAGLGNASDFMPETADGDAFGTGAGFGAGLSGVGFGGGGGGGGYGSGVGGMAGGAKSTGAKLSVPKKSAVKHKPKLALDAPKQGAFCKESNIREVVQKRANALRNCYEQQLLANPELTGKIIVFWKIGLDGKVTDASIKSSTMNHPRVEACLMQTVRRLKFDKPDGGICVVEFPFIFTSAQ